MRGGGEELCGAGGDLADHPGGGELADPGGGDEQVPLGAKGRHHLPDLRLQPGDHRVQVIDVV